MKINNWLGNIQDWLLPRLCPGCHNWTGPGRELCDQCERQLPWLTQACPRCAQPFDHPGVNGLCGACQRRPPAFSSTCAAFHYAPPVDHFVRSLKFSNDLGMAVLLGHRLAQVARLAKRPDLIVPVPLHRSRLRSRGYNQALEIARVVARTLDLPLDAHGLVRRRPTAAQSQLPVAARRRNVRGAFAVRRGVGYRDLRIALIDDVMTTGSTVEAAARALRAAGTRDVVVWSVARAGTGDDPKRAAHQRLERPDIPRRPVP